MRREVRFRFLFVVIRQGVLIYLIFEFYVKVEKNTASCMSRCIAGIVGEIAEYSLLNRKTF